MDKTFDELFDDFFKKNNIKPSDKLTDNEQGMAKQMLELLTKGLSIPLDDDHQEKEIDSQLGKPDKVEFFNEGNMFFERRIWRTELGEIHKVIITDDSTLLTPPQLINLQNKLDEAVANEEYEKACKLRDLIKAENKNKKKLAKSKNK